ncbi:MAG: hypothetical protein GF421_01410 [Candidatus Aminicenantes bacterium]|nr:hypothetical protein [Candidatus Aminicenantes bacterium]
MASKNRHLTSTNRIHSCKWIAFILMLCLVLRLLFCFVIFPRLSEERGEELGWTQQGKLSVEPYSTIAENVASGKGFRDNTHQINFERLPLYVLFLASIYRVWGNELWKVQVVQSLLDTISCFLIFLISLKIFSDQKPGLWAAFFYAVYFKVINMVSRPLTEIFYIFVFLLFIYFFISSLNKNKMRFSLVTGLLLGFMTLTKPITLLFPLIGLGYYSSRPAKTNWKKGFLFLSGFLVIILPFLVRNYLLEKKVFLATGGGKALYMGTFIDYSNDFREQENRIMKEIKNNYDGAHNIEDDRKLLKISLDKIRAHPLKFLKKAAHRIYLFWSYPDFSTKMMSLKTLLISLFNLTLIILAFVGFSASKKKGIFFSPFLAIILYFYVIHTLIYSHSRYSLPLFPILFLFSAFGVLNLAEKLKIPVSFDKQQ